MFADRVLRVVTSVYYYFVEDCEKCLMCVSVCVEGCDTCLLPNVYGGQWH